MSYLIMDTETTERTPGYIAQFSAIKITGKKVTGFNEWYKVKEMADGAAKVNGLSVALCEELSGGKTFMDKIDNILSLLEGVTDIYGYNTDFDRRFLEAEFLRCSLHLPTVAWQDVMTTAKKAMNVTKGYKLGNAIEFFGISDETIFKLAKTVFGGTESYHDARYDTAATMLVARKLDML